MLQFVFLNLTFTNHIHYILSTFSTSQCPLIIVGHPNSASGTVLDLQGGEGPSWSIWEVGDWLGDRGRLKEVPLKHAWALEKGRLVFVIDFNHLALPV